MKHTVKCIERVGMGKGERMATQKIRIKLKSYDHNLIDLAASRIMETALKSGSQVAGPIPLPVEREVVTVIRAPHKYKDSREQFERRTHKRLIEIVEPNAQTIEALMHIDLPSGVDIVLKK